MTVFPEGGADRDTGIQGLEVRIGIALPDKCIECIEIKPQIQVMDEGFFLVTDINECSI